MGFELLLLWNGQMTMGFGMVQETVILTPRTLSFSLVFFISVTAQWTRPDSIGLRQSADPSTFSEPALEGYEHPYHPMVKI